MSWLFALRLGRWGGLGFGALAVSAPLLQATSFYQLAGSTAAQRAAFGRSMMQVAGQFTVLIPAPVRPDTIGGFVQWRAYGFLAIVVAIWAFTSATGAARGDEERGTVEAVLATGVARADALWWRFAAYTVYVAAAAGAAAAAFVLVLAGHHDPVDWAALAGQSIALAGLALCCYSVVLLVCQLTAPRLASIASAGVLLALFLVNSLSRSLDPLKAYRWISPFHYYDASNPLAPGGNIDVRAVEILFVAAALLGLLAALAFAYRDLGSALWTPPAAAWRRSRRVTASPLLRVAVVRGLYLRWPSIAAWALAFAALGATFVVLTRQMVGPLLALQGLAPYFNGIIHGDIYPSFLGVVWFGFAQLLVAGYAISQVARWSAEDGDGRLEATLANPVSRPAVVLERAVVLAVATLLIVAVGGIAVSVASHRNAIELDPHRLAIATALLVPFATFFAAIGAVVAARLPRATAGLLGAVAAASYFLTQIGPLFRWPSWTQDLSPFHLYGQPLTGGVDPGGFALLVAVTLGGFAGSAFLLQGRDVGS